MSQIASRLDVGSDEFKSNQAHHQKLASQLKDAKQKISEGGGEDLRKKHENRKKLFVRDRIKKLLDPDSPFLEIGALAGLKLYEDQAPSAGVVTGVGRVNGLEVMIIAN
ncbi:MAG: Propionyl-CoA carboxylase, partial [Bacteriovoracaceae bacterium]|nr:Propionyl-CoA carboxylase [Bacteriovoracaceae bacterium]